VRQVDFYTVSITVVYKVVRIFFFVAGIKFKADDCQNKQHFVKTNILFIKKS
jgi:hypothetical protein